MEELARSKSEVTPDASGDKLQQALAAVAATEVRRAGLDRQQQWRMQAFQCAYA